VNTLHIIKKKTKRRIEIMRDRGVNRRHCVCTSLIGSWSIVPSSHPNLAVPVGRLTETKNAPLTAEVKERTGKKTAFSATVFKLSQVRKFSASVIAYCSHAANSLPLYCGPIGFGGPRFQHLGDYNVIGLSIRRARGARLCSAQTHGRIH
jgi:hypothetical protein